MARDGGDADESDVFKEENQFPHEWVKRICGENVSSFIINKELAAKFNKLKCFNETADQDFKQVLRILHKLKDELENGSEPVSITPEIDPSHLQEEVLSSLKILAEFQQELGVDRKSSFSTAATLTVLGRHQLTTDTSHTELLTNNAVRNLSQLSNITDQMLADCQSVRTHLTNLQKEGRSQKHSKRAKAQEINSLRAEKESAIKMHTALSMDAEGLHESAAVHKQVRELLALLDDCRGETGVLQDRLAKYGELPPDLRLAKEHLQAKQSELQNLKGEIAFLVSSMGNDCFS